MNRTKYGIFGAAAAAVALGSGAYAATTTRAASITNTPPTYVVKIAEQQAKENGDPTPAGAVVIDTTRGAAMHAAEVGGVDGSQIPVWLVVLHGYFKDRNASVPAGQPLPTGHVILFTINKRTHQIMDFGIGDRSPNLSSFGTLDNFS
ncbi:hypothetical protein [Sulfobacillus harzensis]|uniref:Uncharacterized protein n=1 Tax=Sulfobacillus harzensis TaxID=2729629 RepID=A0A7Y0L471_9FIRM|nr:hypothetical protein [Sulfobacillus harzensis]NMP22361.1 hypothetical protein [Sulfobacillus harzensis]